jgi:acetolactate synthase-1/2/3 large subunit
MLVAEYIAQFLVEKNIKHIFGYPGSAMLKVLHSIINTNEIEYVQNYHEQASSFAADAYARVTGDIGVAIATSGPGAINLISGICSAYFDSVPCLFLTGQDHAMALKKNSGVRSNGFQDLDIVTMVKHVTKYASTIKKPDQIRYEMEKAYYLATSGRPGSVLLDIPIDIQFKEIDINKLKGFKTPQKSLKPAKSTGVASHIKKSKRPVILVGGGVRISGAQQIFKQFVDLVKIPVVSTLNGLDVYPNTFGFAGIYGNSYSNLAVLNSDLLIVLGSRLGKHHVGKNKENYTKAKIIHVDIDKSELNRSLGADLTIHSDLKSFLTTIMQELRRNELPDFKEWHKQIEFWSKKYKKNTHNNKVGVDPVEFIELVTDLFEDDAVMTSDIGQNQMWVAQGVKIKNNQRLLNSSGLGPMGYSLPAAIGAKIARPKNQVFAFMGDGGLQINVQELHFIGQKELDIKIIVFNNNTLGMIRETQEKHYNAQYYGTNPSEFTCTDLRLLARAYNLKYVEIKRLQDVKKIKKSLTNKKPCLIDVKISLDSKCLNRYDDLKKISGDISVE